MSWQDYVTSFLVNNTDANSGKTATNLCEHGAIIGNTDGTVWASTPGFTLDKYSLDQEKEDGTKEKIEVDEFASLADAFNNQGNTSRKGGIRIHKEKYFSVSFDSDRNVLYLKKNGGGAAVAKSNLGFVIATFSSKLKSTNYNGAEEPQNPGLLNGAVEKLQTFLVDNSL
jgi:hypothetical protein